jgi:MYXO-CTERM domain-containing protein
VLRIDHVGDATVADNAYLWLNPNPLVEPLIANADVTILSGDTNSRDLSNIDFVRPFVGNAQNTALTGGFPATNWRPFGVLAVDEIRLGTTYADMSAVPEPAALGLLALGGLLRLRRR